MGKDKKVNKKVKKAKIKEITKIVPEVEKKEEPTAKWKPVAKEKRKGNGNFFTKMVDFFDF